MLKKISFHIIFWTIIAGINFGFSIRIFPLNIASLSTLTVLSFQTMVFYLNTLILFPKYFSLSKTTRFFILSLLFVLVITICQTSVEVVYISKNLAGRLHPFNVRFISMIFMRIFFWLLFIDVLGTVFMMQERIREQTEKTQKITADKLNTELKLLKAQINPHFIFNALNNIYSLTYMKSEKAPDSVLKLSQMLRYVIEDCEQEKVSLASEIEYIQNYIAFQKMKSAEEQNIVFNYPENQEHILIAPMIFIPLIENSFKYSKVEELPDAFININLNLNQGELHFQICNSVPVSGKTPPGPGTGLNNVRQRLNIIYPQKHNLEIRDGQNDFSVQLTLVVQ